MSVGRLSDKEKTVIVITLAAPIEYGHGSRWQ